LNRTADWDSDNCCQNVTISCLLSRSYPVKNEPYLRGCPAPSLQMNHLTFRALAGLLDLEN